MEKLTLFVRIIGEISVVVGVFVAFGRWISRISNGQKCLLRKDMLDIYYHNKDTKKIRQYEYENFVHLYEAYKSLKGNSFIDKIYEEVQSWEVIT